MTDNFFSRWRAGNTDLQRAYRRRRELPRREDFKRLMRKYGVLGVADEGASQEAKFAAGGRAWVGLSLEHLLERLANCADAKYTHKHRSDWQRRDAYRSDSAEDQDNISMKWTILCNNRERADWVIWSMIDKRLGPAGVNGAQLAGLKIYQMTDKPEHGFSEEENVILD